MVCRVGWGGSVVRGAERTVRGENAWRECRERVGWRVDAMLTSPL